MFDKQYRTLGPLCQGGGARPLPGGPRRMPPGRLALPLDVVLNEYILTPSGPHCIETCRAAGIGERAEWFPSDF